MKQNMQQTAVQKALQPIARQIKTGYEQFDILDTENTIQQQADDNEAELEESQRVKRKREDNIQRRLEDELEDPTPIGQMMASSSSNIRGNLRGSSSSSSAAAAAAPQEEEEEEEDIYPNVKQIIDEIEIIEYIKKLNNYAKIMLIDITYNRKNNIHTSITDDLVIEYEHMQHILTSFKELRTIKKLKKNKTPEFRENLEKLRDETIKVLNKHQ
jgi:hypothetical protein